jgi:hypothetical protein
MTWIWSSVQKDGIFGCHFILATLRVIINAWKGYFAGRCMHQRYDFEV